MPKTSSSGAMHRLVLSLPETHFQGLARASKDSGESINTHIRRAVHRYLGYEGEPVDRVTRTWTGRVRGPVPPLLAPPPGAAPPSKKLKVRKRRPEATVEKRGRVTMIRLDPSTTGLEHPIEVSLSKAKHIWALVPAAYQGTDEALARDIAPRVGLGVLEVMELLNLFQIDEALVARLEGR